jgi:CRP/FNR family transcriptional regulator, cyclic AMP receptor protein
VLRDDGGLPLACTAHKLTEGELVALIDKYQGDEGKRLRLDALLSQKLVANKPELAAELEAVAEFISLEAAQVLIEQDDDDNDIYFIASGDFSVIVNGRPVNRRTVNDHVGEMAAIEPAQLRAATIRADTEAVVAKVPESKLYEIANRHPEVYRYIARELSRRLKQRNSLVLRTNDRVRVLIFSSGEAVNVAREVQAAFDRDPLFIEVWPEVFRASHYTLEDLERKLDDTDFVIAIAQGDDKVESRNKEWPAPRDNVIFELGLAMGKLGRHRAILMEPREETVKLPSDLAGVTTVTYKLGLDKQPDIQPACTKLRKLFKEGPR